MIQTKLPRTLRMEVRFLSKQSVFESPEMVDYTANEEIPFHQLLRLDGDPGFSQLPMR